MPANSIIRALDIGYGNTKFVIDDCGNCRMFPSLAPRVKVRPEDDLHYQKRQTTQIWVENCAYEVGPDTALFSNTPVLHSDYISTDQFLALFYGALDAMQVPRIDLLVTGLPVHLHATRACALEEMLLGIHEVRPGVKVKVKEALITVQPLGGFVAHIHDRGQQASMPEKTCLLVDAGFFTLDWMVNRGMQELPGRSGSVECGVSAYVKSVEEELNRDMMADHSDIRRIDEGFRCGNFRLRGNEVNLKDFSDLAEDKVMQALCALRNRIGNVDDIDEIVVVGGGGPYFAKGLRRTFPTRQVYTVRDPVFANVRGFQQIGKIYHRNKAK